MRRTLSVDEHIDYTNRSYGFVRQSQRCIALLPVHSLCGRVHWNDPLALLLQELRNPVGIPCLIIGESYDSPDLNVSQKMCDDLLIVEDAYAANPCFAYAL